MKYVFWGKYTINKKLRSVRALPFITIAEKLIGMLPGGIVLTHAKARVVKLINPTTSNTPDKMSQPYQRESHSYYHTNRYAQRWE